eukprot:gene13634-15685_t
MGALGFGMVLAVLVFWAVGAHNRLVRLRGEVVRQWSSVDAVWLRLLVRLQGGLAARQVLASDGETQDLQQIQTICDDLLEALTQARLQPLDEDSQKQVVSQHLKLVAAIRLMQQTVQESIRPDLDIALNRMRQTLPAALIPYHVAVLAYNEALSMRPASWLGKRLKFKPAIRMDLSLSPLWRLLQATASAVQAVRAGRSLTAQLQSVPHALRPGVQSLSFHALRQLGRATALRELLASKAPPPAADALLCTALALCWDESQAPYPVHTLVNQVVQAARQQRSTQGQSGFINACLRRFLRERQALVDQTSGNPQAQWNHPLWWIERLQADHPEHWQALLRMAQTPAPMTLRVNRQHHNVRDYQDALAAQGLASTPVGPDGLQLDKAVPVHQLPGFEQGHASVQDAAAQVAAPLMLQDWNSQHPWRVLDACAAPGGKTGHLLEICPQAQVLALDVDEDRCARIHENLERLGVKAQVRAADASMPETWWDGLAFDAILLDAPCTASGIVRRHPDVRWLRRPTDSAQLAKVQAHLLETLWPLLKVGGRLLYCTCSVFKLEGDDVMQAFLQRNTDAVLLPSAGHLIPGNAPSGLPVVDNHLGEHDGFYYALLEKRQD